MPRDTLVKEYALLALNSLDSDPVTAGSGMAKKVMLRAVAAAVLMTAYIEHDFVIRRDTICLDSEVCKNPTLTAYQKTVLGSLFRESSRYEAGLELYLRGGCILTPGQMEAVEKALALELEQEELLEEIQNLTQCDLQYKDSMDRHGEYRTVSMEYDFQVEKLRLEVLQEKSEEPECAVLLWLLRESGVLRDIFTGDEMPAVIAHMRVLQALTPLYEKLYRIQIHQTVENTVLPSGSAFPSFGRYREIFIDTEAWFTSQTDILGEVKQRLRQRGHTCEVFSLGENPVIRIDNDLYEARPCTYPYRIPVRGLRFRRYLR